MKVDLKREFNVATKHLLFWQLIPFREIAIEDDIKKEVPILGWELISMCGGQHGRFLELQLSIMIHVVDKCLL